MSEGYCPLMVGDKVVCVVDWEPHPLLVVPKKGEVYTVRAIAALTDGVGVLLEEIRNPVAKTDRGRIGETHFVFAAFRRVLPDTKPAVESLKQMLSDHVKKGAHV